MSVDRLLILDDDIAIGQALAFMAEDIGLEARITTNALEFFAVLDEWDPTHVTVDLVMPDVDGVEVIRLLAARGCTARVIISSGVGSRILDAARRSAAEHGLDIAGVLSKPFLPSALKKLLGANEVEAAARHAPAPGLRARFEVTETALREAIEGNQLQLVYQPKIACRNGTLAGFEALTRWHHPQAGIIMPDQFIAQAEQWGLIDALTNQVSDRALRWLSHAFPGSAMSVSVNISARSLVDFQLADLASSLCQQLSIGPARLIFELTETSAMRDPVTALDLLTRLRMKGFQLSIDDFGTGYSSMVQLVRLPFSEIKIDKSFVMTAAHSQEARTVTKSIVDLGQSLGLNTTAEGVEDATTLEFLRSINCTYAQGYFIARPMSGEAVAGWIAAGHLHTAVL